MTMRGDEFPVDALPQKLEEFPLVVRQSEPDDKQTAKCQTDAKKWTSTSLPTSRRPSTTTLVFTPPGFRNQASNELMHFNLNGFSPAPLSHDSLFDVRLPSDHSITPDLYTDFSFLRDTLSAATSVTSVSSIAPIGSCPTTPNHSLSLSPLCFAHSRSRSRSRSPSPLADFVGFVENGKNGDASNANSVENATKKMKIPRHKRPSHQRAEVKRRNRIQDGLDQLRRLVPTDASDTSSTSSRSKSSKSDLLRRSADYCRRLHMEYNSMLTEADGLRAELLALTADTKRYQDELPPEGVNHKRSRRSGIPIEQMFSDYVKSKALGNWKFWIFGQLMSPVFESYNQAVRPSGDVDMAQSILQWQQDCMSLISLRPALLSGLRTVVTSTSALTQPDRLESEIRHIVLTDSGIMPPTTAVPSLASR